MHLSRQARRPSSAALAPGLSGCQAFWPWLAVNPLIIWQRLLLEQSRER
jgi:hypothetical protein